MPTTSDQPAARRLQPLSGAPIADALVHVQCAHISLARLNHVGLLAREHPFFARACPSIAKAVAMVSYGDAADASLAASLQPAGWSGRFCSISNDQNLEPARFQASVPDRVASRLREAGCRSALVVTDQHYGGEVAVQTAAALRAAGLRVGLVARCGYHWSWTVARDTAPDDPRAIAAALLEGDLCRSADAVIATTRRIAADLAWQHHLSPERVSVVPNFVLPPDAPPPFSDRTPGLVLFAGRLEAEKRLDLLVRAMAIVAPAVPESRLVIVGDGSLSADLQALAARLNVPVEFRPRLPHDQLLREMGRCSVYAQVSRFEGHPKTILEALAMGAPCVVTRAPGVDDEIVPDHTGIVCRDQPEHVANAIIALLRDPAHAAHISAAAAIDIRSRLTLDAVFPLMEAVWRKAIRSAGSGLCAPRPPVRWEQTLLNADPDGAAIQFAASIQAYARRLHPDARAAFLDALTARTSALSEIAPEILHHP